LDHGIKIKHKINTTGIYPVFMFFTKP